MTKRNDRTRGIATGAPCAAIFFASLLSFLCFYIPYLYFYDNDAVSYTAYFVRSFIDALIPVFSAAFLFAAGSERGRRQRACGAARLALPRLIYLVPYYYLYYMSEGYDTIETLGLLALRTVLMLLIFAAEIFIFCAIARAVFKRKAPTGDAGFANAGLFELAAPSVAAVFSIAFAKFILLFAGELIDAVEYAIEYAGTYRESELYFIIGSFVFTLATLLLSHAATCGCLRLAERKGARREES